MKTNIIRKSYQKGQGKSTRLILDVHDFKIAIRELEKTSNPKKSNE
jgi:hypothetical protein